MCSISDPTTVCREMKTYLLWGYASPVGVWGSTEPPCNWGSLGKRPCVVCRHCRWSAWARSPRHVPAASSALCKQSEGRWASSRVWKAGESRMCPSGGGYLDGEFSGTKMQWLDRKNCWLRCNSSTVGVGVRGTAIPPIPFPVFSPLP